MPTPLRETDPTWPYPLTRKQIELLDEALYVALTAAGCDGTTRLTRVFLDGQTLPIDDLVEWLKSKGGYCDCEVYLNVTGRMMRWVPISPPAAAPAGGDCTS